MTIEELADMIYCLEFSSIPLGKILAEKLKTLYHCIDQAEKSSLDLKITKDWNPPVTNVEEWLKKQRKAKK